MFNEILDLVNLFFLNILIVVIGINFFKRVLVVLIFCCGNCMLNEYFRFLFLEDLFDMNLRVMIDFWLFMIFIIIWWWCLIGFFKFLNKCLILLLVLLLVDFFFILIVVYCDWMLLVGNLILVIIFFFLLKYIFIFVLFFFFVYEENDCNNIFKVKKR